MFAYLTTKLLKLRLYKTAMALFASKVSANFCAIKYMTKSAENLLLNQTLVMDILTQIKTEKWLRDMLKVPFNYLIM